MNAVTSDKKEETKVRFVTRAFTQDDAQEEEQVLGAVGGVEAPRSDVTFAVSFDDDETQKEAEADVTGAVETLRQKLMNEEGHEVAVTTEVCEVEPVVIESRGSSLAGSCDRSRASSVSRRAAVPEQSGVTDDLALPSQASPVRKLWRSNSDPHLFVNTHDTDLNAGDVTVNASRRFESFLDATSAGASLLSFNYASDERVDAGSERELAEIFPKKEVKPCKRYRLPLPPSGHDVAERLQEFRGRSDSF